MSSGSGQFDIGDPLGLNKAVAGPTHGNAISQLGAGPLYKPPVIPKTPEELAKEDEANKQTLRDSIDTLYGVGGTPDASAAATQLQSDDNSVSQATSDYYSDQLSRSFAAASRNNKFNLARQGLLGGSQDIDSNTELNTDQATGETRIDQAARSAAASLDASRENERLNSIGLVNAGAGTDAVNSAQAGLSNTLANAQNQSRANIFSDLFANGADTFATQNINAANAAALARYQQSLTSFFPTSNSGGVVTPSS